MSILNIEDSSFNQGGLKRISAGDGFARMGITPNVEETLQDVQYSIENLQKMFNDNDINYRTAQSAVSRKVSKTSKNKDIRNLYFEGQEEGANYNAALRSVAGDSPEGLEFLNLVVVGGEPYADMQMGGGKVARVPITNTQFLSLGKAREQRRIQRLEEERKANASRMGLEAIRQNATAFGLSEEELGLFETIAQIDPDSIPRMFRNFAANKQQGTGNAYLQKNKWEAVNKENFSRFVTPMKNLYSDLTKQTDDLDKQIDNLNKTISGLSEADKLKPDKTSSLNNQLLTLQNQRNEISAKAERYARYLNLQGPRTYATSNMPRYKDIYANMSNYTAEQLMQDFLEDGFITMPATGNDVTKMMDIARQFDSVLMSSLNYQTSVAGDERTLLAAANFLNINPDNINEKNANAVTNNDEAIKKNIDDTGLTVEEKPPPTVSGGGTPPLDLSSAFPDQRGVFIQLAGPPNLGGLGLTQQKIEDLSEKSLDEVNEYLAQVFLYLKGVTDKDTVVAVTEKLSSLISQGRRRPEPKKQIFAPNVRFGVQAK
tara:strand:+ start:2064 stop:3695 length:1632 start_codon:yes stop_codon:yes gene_type:complete